MDYPISIIRKEKKTAEALVFALGILELSDHHPTCTLYRMLLEACEMYTILNQRRGHHGRTT